jgi:hypothetical protein
MGSGKTHNDLIKKISASLAIREPEKEISGRLDGLSFDFYLKIEERYVPIFKLNYSSNRLLIFPAANHITEESMSLVKATARNYGFRTN